MQPPKDAIVYDMEIVTCWLGEEGILYVRPKTTRRTLENCKPTLELFKKLSEERGRLLLISDISSSPVPSQEVRAYMSAEIPKYIKAMAMISTSKVGYAVAFIYSTLVSSSYPVKVFSNENEAKEWLNKQ